MATLHSYILRELLKTFALALALITGLLILCTSVFGLVKYEGVTAVDVITASPYILVAVIPWGMPVAALFACTLIYGRLSADNELLACRAAGINIRRLFLPGFAISIFVALCTLLLLGQIAPAMQQHLEGYLRKNLRDLAASQLRAKGYFNMNREKGNKVLFTAERVTVPSAAELREAGHDPTAPGVSYLQTDVPTFLQRDRNDEMIGFSSADIGLCKFETASDPVKLTVYVRNLRQIEMGKHAVRLAEQQIGPIEWPFTIAPQINSADLGTLRQWLREPWRAERLGDKMREFLLRVEQIAFEEAAVERINGHQSVVLSDKGGLIYSINAKHAKFNSNAPPDLEEVHVQTQRGDQPPLTLYSAPRATLISRATPGGAFLIEVRLLSSSEHSVTEEDLRAQVTRTKAGKSSLSLDDLQMPDEMIAGAAAITPAEVIDVSQPLPVRQNLRDLRIGLLRGCEIARRKIWYAIHLRLAYPASTLPIVLLGAVLGVLFRGSRLIAAFGLACIPMGLVVIFFLAGRTLTTNEATFVIGPIVMWGGLAALLAINTGLLLLGVRR